MLYTEILKLGIKTSKLGFGGMRLPSNENGSIDQAHLQDMIDYCMLSGINYYDTAAVYADGKSETALAQALRKFKRDQYYVANKMPFWKMNNLSDVEMLWKRSLHNMQLDYFDFYLMHSLSKSAVDKMLQISGVNWAIDKKKKGEIKYLGFSIHAEDELLADVLEMYDWDFVQIQYNYLDINDRPGKKGYDRLVARGIPIIIMEPLKGGILSNISDKLAAPFTRLGGTPTSYAFRWLAEQKGIATILSGMSSLEQVQENVATFNNMQILTQEEHATIELVRDNIMKTQRVNCTGCEYCLPCPSGVNIPTNFKRWNTIAMRHSQWISGAEIDLDNARLCTACGNCMKHCPQGINIPKKIQEMIINPK